MPKKIENPADTPVEVYHWWHDRWCEYLNEYYKQKFVEAGLAGLTCTELSHDAPGGSVAFSYAFSIDGSLRFIPLSQNADEICEYDSYEFGIRFHGNLNTNSAEHINLVNSELAKGLKCLHVWCRFSSSCENLSGLLSKRLRKNLILNYPNIGN